MRRIWHRHSARVSSETFSISDTKLIGRLGNYLWRHKILFIGALLLYPIDSLSVIVPPYLVRQILDNVIPQRDLSLLRVYALIYLVALLVEYCAGFISQVAMSILGQRATRTLRDDLFAHVLKLPAKYYDRYPMGRLLTRLTNDVEAMGDIFATGAITVLGDAITLVAIIASMLYINATLAGIILVSLPVLMGVVLVFRIFARQAFRSIRHHLTRINTFLAEHIRGVQIVQVFRQQARVEAEFYQLNQDYRDANRFAILFDATLYAIVEAVGVLVVALLLWYGAVELSVGIIGAGTLVAFIQYIRRLFIPIRDLSNKYTILQSALAAAERIFQLLDEPIEKSEKSAARVLAFKQGIEFKNVWFKYAPLPSEPGHKEQSTKQWVLENICLDIRPGERVALVGTTGCGKTTLLRLLQRFYEVENGQIMLDGQDLKYLNLQALRRLFAVVMQDLYLFQGTVYDNLNITGRLKPDAIFRAARAVQLDAVIRNLEQQYETPVSELGANFSSGERQLLAFARALALDPPILILDEATSQVDSETEAKIQAALKVLLSNRTALIVAHRLSTIQEADRIVVMQKGRIVESGTHQGLIHQGGLYHKLLQAREF